MSKERIQNPIDRTVVTTCPTHTEAALLVGWDNDGIRLGFCRLCLRNYTMCTANHHMDICLLTEGHAGPHRASHGGEDF